jgi:hypothetical protein
MTIELQDTISSLDNAIDSNVSLHGRIFVLSDDSSVLAANHEAFRSGEFVELDDQSSIAKALLAMLPVSGGGDCLYNEECAIAGKLVEQDGRKRLVEITNCCVTDEDGESHEITIG